MKFATQISPLLNFKIVMFDFQVEKVLTGFPADYAGLKPHDFLVSVQGKEIFDMNHKQVVELIKSVGNTLNITIER